MSGESSSSSDSGIDSGGGPRTGRKSALRLGSVLAPLLVGLILIASFLFVFLDLPAVVSVMQRANIGWYSLAFVGVTAGVGFYALAWRSLLLVAAIKLTFRRTLSLTWTSIFFNLMVPTGSVSGEVARVYLASKEANVSPGDIGATILSHRVITLLPFISNSVLGVILLGTAYKYPAWLMATVSALVGILATVFVAACYLCLRPEKLTTVLGSVARLGSRLLRRPVESTPESSGLTGQLASLRSVLLELKTDPRRLVQPIVYSYLFWLSDVSVAYFVFLALGADVPVDLIAVVYTIGITMQMVPLGIPGNVGPVELVMTALYSLAGVNATVSAAATMLIRFAMMWFEVAVGGVATYLFEPTALGLKRSRKHLD